ncbi:MAG TPA: carbamoyltransferase HypF [Candidatus Udaeobacter sp.]
MNAILDAAPGARRSVQQPSERLRIVVRGAVQGVGFRPFVYRLATELQLNGSVSNSSQGVFIEIEGARHTLDAFLNRIRKETPQRALIQSLESSFLNAIGYTSFEITQSDNAGDKTALILQDIATCDDCVREIFDPANRRFRYPFTNCTNCGPRFSIIEELPYDRANTSMKQFVMCAKCECEYHDPLDRRFHAQPNACPECGPELQLWDEHGAMISKRGDALRQAADAIQRGKILALKAIGGFQLIVDARSEEAVTRLRKRKHREEKPFAVMYPSADAVRTNCEVSKLEEQLLVSPESPIVLVSAIRNSQSAIAPSIAPRNPTLGVMLPYTPLHHLLMHELRFPIVATSGNLSDEPICIGEREALRRLRGIADLFLAHDRPIVRHVDDSVVRVMCGREMVLRRARGYAPLPVAVQSRIDNRESRIVLAVGAHLKSTVALKIDNNIFVSQHIGDLETKQAYGAFCRAATDLPRIYDARIHIVACDTHPDYLSTKYAQELQESVMSSPFGNSEGKLSLVEVQHHFAHVVACMAENEIEAPALGVVWDGTGYGLDGTIWGGEFLLLKKDGSFERVAHFRRFRLAGGDRAIKEPRRSALGMLYEIFGEDAWDFPRLVADFSEEEKSLFRQMLEKEINAPLTSSVGRLFDAVAAVVGLRQRSNFEGQAAVELEFTRRESVRDAYPFVVNDGTPIVVDWAPAIRELLNDVASGQNVGIVSAKFHNGLVEAAVGVAKRIGEQQIVLTGGCFQNRYLTEHSVDRLREEGFQPYWHQRIPPNDGGIALGQAVAASWRV